jgi:hypothetical protein
LRESLGIVRSFYAHWERGDCRWAERVHRNRAIPDLGLKD